ncbi:hypothetical protein HRbin40_00387 [bacterium HR40]|nr:hypothetical protein HRbin40_00387 [bacterium HR40]
MLPSTSLATAANSGAHPRATPDTTSAGTEIDRPVDGRTAPAPAPVPWRAGRNRCLRCHGHGPRHPPKPGPPRPLAPSRGQVACGGGVRMPANGPGDRPARLVVLCRSRDGAWVRIRTHLATRLAPRERAFGLRRVTVQLPGHGWERRAGAPASASSAGPSSPSRRSPAKASGVARIRPPFAPTGGMVGEPSPGVVSPPLPLGDAPWALSAPARHPTGCRVGRIPLAVPLAILAARRIPRSRSPRHRAFGSGR